MKQIGIFISDQVFGMKWINNLVGFLLELIGIDINTTLGGALQFFVYDVIKIVILLCFLIFTISYIQSFFPPEKTKKILGKFKGIKGNIMGALLGTVTPFCSCSSIPIFMGFVSSGMPIGVTISFLISSPFVDLASMILLMTLFGPAVAITYMIVGIALAVIGGTIIEKMGYGEHIHDFVKRAKNVDVSTIEMNRQERFKYAYEQMSITLKKVFIFIIIGVGIGALIHNVIPEGVITSVIGVNNPFAPILAALVSIPIYADIFGTLPVAEALFIKNVPIGTILTFMMGVTALSLPSMVMLSKVMKPKLLIAFISIVSIGIILIGYLFNLFGHLII
jgi:uncharacterized membrane protein YraQ (UPF0718 family)